MDAAVVCETFTSTGKVRRYLSSAAGVGAKVSFTSSNQNVPLISGLPGTRITLIAISRVCGPVAKSANSFLPAAGIQQVLGTRQ